MVAVKVLHSQWPRGSERWSRFERGARTQARLCIHHPSIVNILSEGLLEDCSHFYCVLEHMPGLT